MNTILKTYIHISYMLLINLCLIAFIGCSKPKNIDNTPYVNDSTNHGTNSANSNSSQTTLSQEIPSQRFTTGGDCRKFDNGDLCSCLENMPNYDLFGCKGSTNIGGKAKKQCNYLWENFKNDSGGSNWAVLTGALMQGASQICNDNQCSVTSSNSINAISVTLTSLGKSLTKSNREAVANQNQAIIIKNNWVMEKCWPNLQKSWDNLRRLGEEVCTKRMLLPKCPEDPKDKDDPNDDSVNQDDQKSKK